MDGYVIITTKEDLAQVIRGAIAELSLPEHKHAVEPKYLDMDKLLEFLRQNNCRISRSQIYKLTRSKKIPHRKLGKNLLFNSDEILDWINSSN